MKKISKFGILLAMITVAIAGCTKDTNDDDLDIVNNGKGIGQIEFQGSSFQLVEAYSIKQTSWYPPPLGICFHNCDNNDNGNSIIIMILSHLYNTWPTIELPAGTYENFYFEFSLDDGTQGMSSSQERFETRMDVKKSDSDYDITLTGKTYLYRVKGVYHEGEPLQDFKMTWKGKIRIIERDEISIR